MVFRVQTDETGKLFKGNFGEEDGAAYISLASADGSFIGFITQASGRSNSKPPIWLPLLLLPLLFGIPA